MTIYDRQYTKLLSMELLRYILQGSLPDLASITKRIDDLQKKNGAITYKFLPQLKGEVFNNKIFNRQLNSIHFDIETVHEELIELFVSSVKRLNYADVYYRVHSHELNNLEAVLNSILFTFDNADFFFLGAFDTFTDYSKTDKTVSDQDIINLSEKAIALPYGGQNTHRIKSPHLIDVKTWPVSVLTPSGALGSQVSSTSFGDIFTDVATGWLYEVTTTESTPATIQFKFPIAGNAADNKEVLVNRFELTSFGATPTLARIQFSVDDQNWKNPEGYEEGVLMTDQKFVYAMDFPTELVQYVRITLSKNTHDEERTNRFIYRFGLKGFGAFTTGRKASARYQSKAFTFAGEEEKIGKVSIKADILKPQGTSIDFSVALSDSEGNQVGTFLPIKPIAGNANAGASEIVVFGTTQDNELRFEGESAQFTQYTDTQIRGHTFYQYTTDVTPAPIFGTASMLRGFKAWTRDKSLAISTTRISDNYVSFAKGDLANVYALYTENPIFRSYLKESIDYVDVTTSQSVYYNQNTDTLIPSSQQVSRYDATPTYAVYKVLYISDSLKKEYGVQLVPSNGSRFNLPYSSFVVNGPDALIVRNNGGSITYKPERDYIVETEVRDGQIRPTGWMIIPQGSQIVLDQILGFTFTLDADITYKVKEISGTRVTLADLKINPGDSIQITYRFVPIVPYSIVQSSVRVKDSLLANKTPKVFVEGLDYLFDPVNGTIQRLPNGKIPVASAVYVDYVYENADSSVETFLTWCNITSPDGVQIKFQIDNISKKNPLVADDTLGERFFVNSAAGLIDLTKAIATPILGPGWVQFIVRSKNPDTNQKTDNRGNLIDQVIQLKDYNGSRVFLENAKYFKDILALRDPMVQRTVNHLKVNTLVSDHTVFAIDETVGSRLVLNFKPGNTGDLYLKVPQDASSSTVQPATINEIFKLNWQSKIINRLLGTGIIVRCDLSRDPSTDDGISPKCFSYYIKAST